MPLEESKSLSTQKEMAYGTTGYYMIEEASI